MPLKKKRKVIPKRKTVKKAVKAKKKPPVVRKKIVRKPAKPKENIVGAVTHYFSKVGAAVIKLKAPLSVGDNIKIKGHTTDFTQNISSMQIDHVPITKAKKGAEIGVLVNSRVREHDIVYKV